MKKIISLFLGVLSCFLFTGCLNLCQHEYSLVDSKAPTCVEKGYDLYQCGKCQDVNKEEKEGFGAHVYDKENTCVDRACVTKGCTHVEKASTEHEYTQEYVCADCGEAKTCTLEILGQDFSEGLLEQARINAGEMTGNFEIVVLNAEKTLENIQPYVFSADLDKEKIVGGLFVKFDVTNGGTETLFTIYYNFGLQFSEEMTADVAVSFDGSFEAWKLEVVEGNKTIVFEYSIV